MRVRCRAAADARGNAVGSLELECTTEGLRIAYLRVARYREGYAPGPVAQPSERCVPWHSVHATRLGLGHLLLSVDEKLSPLNRFCLSGFSRRAGFPVAWSRLAHLRVPSHAVLADFCHELSRCSARPVPVELGRLPALARTDGTPGAGWPRAVVAVSILLGATGLAALTIARSPRDDTGSAPLASQLLAAPPVARQGLTPASPSLSEPEDATLRNAQPARAAPKPQLGAGCDCVRHESLFWQRPPPRLSTFVTERQVRMHGAHEHLELELAAVNNGDHELEHLHLTVVFHDPSRRGETSDAKQVKRGLYFKGPLRPGRMVRWKTQARAARFEVLAPELGRLDEDGLDAAPANELHALALSPRRAVQLHAGMMLAFLGDPRARPLAEELARTVTDGERDYAGRLLEATASLWVCQLAATPAGPEMRVQGCLYNAASEPTTVSGLTVRALQLSRAPENPTLEPPAVLAEQRQLLSGRLAPRRGRRVEIRTDLTGATRADGSFEEGGLELVVQQQEPGR